MFNAVSTVADFELRADDTVIDIGANIGMFALWTEPQIPQGRLIRIEPNPRALECLRMNVENALRNVDVVAVPRAARTQHGTGVSSRLGGDRAQRRGRGAVVRYPIPDGAVHALAVAGGSRESVTSTSIMVEQMSLPHIMDEHGIGRVNLLKIDCEGSEYEVLRSLDVAHWARIERVVIEYHDFGRDRNDRELMDILRSTGFEAEVVHTFMEGLSALVGARVGIIWAKNFRHPERAGRNARYRREAAAGGGSR